MSENKLRRQLKGLYTTAMVNVGIWTLGVIFLAILIHKGGNLKGLYVILAGGVAVGIQIVVRISNLRKEKTPPVAEGNRTR